MNNGTNQTPAANNPAGEMFRGANGNMVVIDPNAGLIIEIAFNNSNNGNNGNAVEGPLLPDGNPAQLLPNLAANGLPPPAPQADPAVQGLAGLLPPALEAILREFEQGLAQTPQQEQEQQQNLNTFPSVHYHIPIVTWPYTPTASMIGDLLSSYSAVHSQTIRWTVKNSDHLSCAICREDYVERDEMAVLPCGGKRKAARGLDVDGYHAGHRFHLECLKKYWAQVQADGDAERAVNGGQVLDEEAFRMKCPLCRQGYKWTLDLA
jgi:hypothetical protein